MVLVSLLWFVRSGVVLWCGGKSKALGWLKEWMQISVKSGLGSLVRNLAFMVMILRMVNEVKQAGVYRVTNQLIWSWLLLPILVLGNLIRQNAACNKGELGVRFKGYFQFTLLIALVWVLSVPGWEWFIRTVMGVPQAEQVAQVAYVMLGFYVVFAFNNIIDSYFYEVGRTDLLLYQSLGA